MVLIILAGVTIRGAIGDNGIITEAQFRTFASKIEGYQDIVNTYVITQGVKNDNGDGTGIYVNDSKKMQQILDVEEEEAKKYGIQEDELRYQEDYVTVQEKEWLADLSIIAMTTMYLITFIVNGTVYTTLWSERVKFPEMEAVGTGSNFTGWYYDADLTQKATEGDSLSHDITLYAKWGDYTATYMVKGEIYDRIQGNEVTFPEEPELDNVRFEGWYYDEDYTKPVKEGDTLTGDTTIYSKWTSYIKNKLNGTYIHMLDYSGYVTSESQWYYANSIDDIKNDPLYSKVMTGGNGVESYPTWIKLGNYSNGEVLYTYEGSNKIRNIEIISFTRIDGTTPFTEFLIEGTSNGEIIFKTGERAASIYPAKAKIEVTFEDGTTDTDEFYLFINNACFVEGTEITLADGSIKKIEDITYEDELLVWDFDQGCFASAKPLWIMKAQTGITYNEVTFEDGTDLKTVLDHRVFNCDLQKFTSTMDEKETPIGTRVFKQDGSKTKLVARKVVNKEVKVYNIITDYHMNLFANSILTSLRLNNLYKIEDMKFVKDNRKMSPKEKFAEIPEKYIKGLRLEEQPENINQGNDVRHAKTLVEYVKRLLRLEK